MAIAIYGGSFDPPHVGHIAVAEAALKELKIDKLYIVPAYANPFKEGTHAPGDLRLQWLKKIFENEPRIEVSDYEIAQNRPVPTLETVRHFRTIDPMIYLIVGADNLDDLHQWHDFRSLDTLVTWVVASRRGHEGSGMLRQLDVDVDVSSTELREGKKNHLLPESVREAIQNYYHQG